MASINLHLAEVVSVDEELRTIKVQLRDDAAITPDIPIDNPSCKQYIPIVGQQILVMQLFENSWRIVTEFGDEPLTVQKGKPISSGEIMVQSAGGGGFFYADKAGNVVLSDRTLSNILELLVGTAIKMVGDALVIHIKNTAQISVKPVSETNPTSSIEIVKIAPGGIPLAKIVIQDDKIDIDGIGINLGSTPIGGVVMSTSNIPGDYSIDSLGRPVPCSLSVRTSL